MSATKSIQFAHVSGTIVGKLPQGDAVYMFIAPRNMRLFLEDTVNGEYLWQCNNSPSDITWLTLWAFNSDSTNFVGEVNFSADRYYGVWDGYHYAVNLQAGDKLVIYAPPTQDSTFADVCFAI